VLERGPLRAYWLLHGEETFLLERGLAILRRRLLPDGRAGTWRVVWAEDAAERLPGALADLRSPSLFGGPEVLVVRHAEALRDDDQARVLAAIEEPGGGTVVLVARAADQRKRLVAACVKAGAAVAFPPLADPRTAAAWVVRLARERGHDVSAGAADELVERTGTDLGTLAGEVEKLALHVGDGTRIDESHVRTLVAPVRAHAVQELTDRLAARDTPGAARVLRRLLAEGEPPLRVLAFVATNLRRALHVAELAEAGLGADDVARRLGLPPWLVQKSRGRGRAAALARSLHVLRRLDLELKSARDAGAAFDLALLEIVQAPGTPSRAG
jgi:DNA polymerase III subunit delta